MRVINYRINSPEQRELTKVETGKTPLINFTSSKITPNGANLTFSIVTNVNHNLIDNSDVIIKKGNNTTRSKISVTGEKTFVFSLSKLSKIAPTSSERFNSTQALLTLNEPLLAKSACTSFNIFDNGGIIIYSACTFPTNASGNKILTQVLVPIDDFTYNQDICVSDTTFIDWEGNNLSFNGLTLYEAPTYTNIPVFFNSLYATDLRKDEFNANSITQEIIDNTVSDIVDMEKQQFEPYIKNNDDYERASKLVFNLHFRDRSGDTWSVVDNNWDVTYASDKLSRLGFTTDDVRYQKKKLGKSFLRLLFYDSNDRISQKLLCYSTIFIDTDSLYNSLIKNIIKDEDYTIDGTEDIEPLTCQLTVQDKYDYTKSSEGFYLYMFPDVFTTEETTLYMKVEFNHAGYGKTIPLMLQLEDGEPVTFDNFRKTYTETDSEGNTNVNLKQYNEDLFIPVTVKYNDELDKYIYYFPWIEKNDSREINLTFYEPNVN